MDVDHRIGCTSCFAELVGADAHTPRLLSKKHRTIATTLLLLLLLLHFAVNERKK